MRAASGSLGLSGENNSALPSMIVMGNSLAGYQFFFPVITFALGAVVGSFLNVCIYRLPLDLSVNKPRRSFCPSRTKQITWYQKIPLQSWLVLRGKCAN